MKPTRVIPCILRRETERAWLIDDGTREVWVPKLQAERAEDDGTVITMPEWLAKEKGLI